jgi:hypothetical protein
MALSEVQGVSRGGCSNFETIKPKKLWCIFPGRDSLEVDSDDSVQKEIKKFLNLSDTYMDTHLKNYVKDSKPNKPNAPYACVYKF